MVASIYSFVRPQMRHGLASLAWIIAETFSLFIRIFETKIHYILVLLSWHKCLPSSSNHGKEIRLKLNSDTVGNYEGKEAFY